MEKDINWDLVDENTDWVAPKKIWTKDMKIVSKDDMDEEEEYVIF